MAHQQGKKKAGKKAARQKAARQAAELSGQQAGVADPEQLQPFVSKPEDSTTGTAEPGKTLLQVVIETPKGSRNKYTWDDEQKCFVLKSALPAGMAFPYDFGFVPRTRADDGDPLDVLVLMDEPAFPGCAVLVRLIGVLEAEQTKPKTPKLRNDRLIAVAETTHMYAKLGKLKDLPQQALREIEEFFLNYTRVQGKKVKLLGRKGEKTAHALIAQAQRNFAEQ